MIGSSSDSVVAARLRRLIDGAGQAAGTEAREGDMGEQPQQIVASGYDTVAERYAGLERDARARISGGHFRGGDRFYSFDHLPRERLPEMSRLIHGWLAESGLLLCCMETEDTPGMVADWLGAPMYFSSYEPDISRRLLGEAGFDILRDEIEAQSEGGGEVSCLWLLARKR
jgi:hypothetical protein